LTVTGVVPNVVVVAAGLGHHPATGRHTKGTMADAEVDGSKVLMVSPVCQPDF
jgi:hypothetical protein